MLLTIWADYMDTVGDLATHQGVIFRVTDQTFGPSHIVIFVSVDNYTAGCQAIDGVCVTIRDKDLLTRGTGGDIGGSGEQVGSGFPGGAVPSPLLSLGQPDILCKFHY